PPYKGLQTCPSAPLPVIYVALARPFGGLSATVLSKENIALDFGVQPPKCCQQAASNKVPSTPRLRRPNGFKRACFRMNLNFTLTIIVKSF
ncbi:MAG: hypothetical protein N6V49_07990, partial [Serratia symbiotica]|nr:hypothetical protein [Serratia symbiotica]